MSIIDNAKEIASLVKAIGDVELYRKIVELEGEIIELTREKRELEEKLVRQNRNCEIIKALSFDSPFYVRAGTSEKYCARCIENDEIAVHLVKSMELDLGKRVYFCPQCKAKYPDPRSGR